MKAHTAALAGPSQPWGRGVRIWHAIAEGRASPAWARLTACFLIGWIVLNIIFLHRLRRRTGSLQSR